MSENKKLSFDPSLPEYRKSLISSDNYSKNLSTNITEVSPNTAFKSEKLEEIRKRTSHIRQNQQFETPKKLPWTVGVINKSHNFEPQ